MEARVKGQRENDIETREKKKEKKRKFYRFMGRLADMTKGDETKARGQWNGIMVQNGLRLGPLISKQAREQMSAVVRTNEASIAL